MSEYHRQQCAALDAALRSVAPVPQDLQALADPRAILGSQDPKEQLENAENRAKEALQELKEARVNVVRQELLVQLAQLDHEDLQVLRQLLTLKNWPELLASKCGLKCN